QFTAVGLPRRKAASRRLSAGRRTTVRTCRRATDRDMIPPMRSMPPNEPRRPVRPSLLAPCLLAAHLLILGACAPTTDEGDAAMLTAAYSEELCASCAEWNAPQEPFLIHGNSYYVGTRGLAAILITTPEGH